jgi:hypothetical protein
MHSSMRSWVAGPWSILLTFQVINGNGLSAGVGAETAFGVRWMRWPRVPKSYVQNGSD